MRRSIALIGLLSLTFSNVWAANNEGELTLLGKVPGRYLQGKVKTKSHLAKIIIAGSVIKEVTALTPQQVKVLEKEKSIIKLQNSKGKYDVVYPGLFNLHNHTKQNVMPVWGDAHGQFANRFEWRGWGVYKSAVSENMNPWIKDYGKVVNCAAFRWSELQSMVLGTTFLQGPSSCVKDFAIHHVEGGDGWLTDAADSAGKPVLPLLNVAAPTDVVYPTEFTFVWDNVKPRMKAKVSFAQALRAEVEEKCPTLKTKINDAFEKSTKSLEDKLTKAQAAYDKKADSKTLTSLEDAKFALDREVLLDGEVLKIVGSKATLEKACSDVHPKFLRFMSFIYPSLAGKIKAVKSPRFSAVIAHLAEGRRNDPYNKLEFELLKILGLDVARFNLIHGVGVDKAGFAHMAKKGMGLIWSPFSNFLLYGETADILEAKKAGVNIALGSDWTPTGSKSVLEELKIARNYVKKAGLSTTFTDEELYKMVTENSATMLGHLETKAGDGRHGAGKVVADAMATLIVVSENVADPHTNLITAESKDINLVLIHGKALYGNVSYLQQTDKAVEFESMPFYQAGLNDLITRNDKGVPTGVVQGIPQQAEGESGKDVLIKLMKSPLIKKLDNQGTCSFPEEKGFVYQNSLAANSAADSGENDHDHDDEEGSAASADASHPADNLVLLAKKAGINLDRAQDIEKLLGSLIMTQSRNIRSASQAKNAVGYFPSLYSCNDEAYTERFEKFVSASKADKNDEISENLNFRLEFRRKEQDARDAYNAKNPEKPRYSTPHQMANDYGLKYDSEKGVESY